MYDKHGAIHQHQKEFAQETTIDIIPEQEIAEE